MTKQFSTLTLLAAASLAVLAPHAAGAAGVVTFDDPVAAQTVPTTTDSSGVVSGSIVVDNGFVAAIGGTNDGTSGVIDSATGPLISGSCSNPFVCSNSGSQALYLLRNATMTLSAPTGYTFDATSFEAALVSIWSPDIAATGFVQDKPLRLELDGLNRASDLPLL